MIQKKHKYDTDIRIYQNCIDKKNNYQNLYNILNII